MVGEPCTLGHLSWLMPNLSMIINHTQLHRGHQKRATLDSSCDNNVDLWNQGEIIAASFFVPGVAAPRALKQLNKLACWLGKQTNEMAKVLSALATDIDSIRHATFQNRAAIDFLLLAQGHGCQDFDGMCCMNLSDHSQSIHASIQKLMEQTKVTKG